MRSLLVVLCAGALCACGVEQPVRENVAPEATRPETSVPAPIHSADPYATAEKVRLATTKPEDAHGLHNVFQLSPDIISGSEPEGAKALDELEARGVKTIISVDGKIPDAKGAASRGMKYVHIPIQYRGISDEEMLALAKSFRELEPPFYVHCFHGKHRGPAAAEVGRLVRDGVSREEALAEMRQWCGTSPKYTGLYGVIANGQIPDAAATSAFAFDFPSAHPLKGVREAMIAVPRAFDGLKDLSKKDFASDPEHPDVDALNESQKLAEMFKALETDPETLAKPADFREWMASAAKDAATLRDQLNGVRAGQQASLADAKATVERLDKNCNACHKAYRD